MKRQTPALTCPRLRPLTRFYRAILINLYASGEIESGRLAGWLAKMLLLAIPDEVRRPDKIRACSTRHAGSRISSHNAEHE